MSAVPPVATPLSGLARIALSDSQFQRIGELVGTAEQSLVAPPAVRPFVAAALAEKTPVLVVTATGREADDLTAELAQMVGDSVAQFPSWETLPHERLSPRSDTVGRRLSVLRRLAHPEGHPISVIAAAKALFAIDEAE